MQQIENIGIIGGGQMAEALLRGIVEAGLLGASGIMVAEPVAERRAYLEERYGVRTTEDPEQLVSAAALVILAVKPQVMATVLKSYSPFVTEKHLLISIAAGITINQLESPLKPNCRIIRVMPNTPALVLAGASALCGNAHTSRDDIGQAMRIFSAVGVCVELPEHLLDAVTGLSGSGPGYVFTLMEAMIDGGVLAGLPRPVAEKLVLQTFYGSAKLALETGEPAAVLKGRVTSPGGTTIRGIQVLEEAGVRGAIMSAVDEATMRSRELGA